MTTQTESVLKLDVALRILQALGFIGVAIVGGFLIGAGIARMVDSAEEYRLVAGALGVSFVFATLERFVVQAPLLWRWIWTGAGDGLSSFSAFAFLAVVSLATALLAPPSALSPTPQTAEPAPVIATSQAVLFVNVPAAAATPRPLSESVFLIPFFSEAGGCDARSEAFGRGSALDSSTKSFLTNLASGFVRCAKPGRPVRLQVRGFASSRPLDCPGDTGKRSKELNRQVANARAQAVVDELTTAQEAARQAHPDSKGEVLIEPIMWATFEAMKSGQRWNDQEQGTYSTARAILTRRAEVTLLESGDCEVATVLESPPPSAAPVAGPAHESTQSKSL